MPHMRGIDRYGPDSSDSAEENQKLNRPAVRSRLRFDRPQADTASIGHRLRTGGWLTLARLRSYAVIFLPIYVLAAVLWIALADGLIARNGKPLGTDFSNVYASGTLAHAWWVRAPPPAKTGLVPRLTTAILATGIVQLGVFSFAVGLLLDAIARSRREANACAISTCIRSPTRRRPRAAAGSRGVSRHIRPNDASRRHARDGGRMK